MGERFPKEEKFRSERAKLNMKRRKANEGEAEKVVVEMKEKIDAYVNQAEGSDDAAREKFLTEAMTKLGSMCDDNEVAWDTLMKCKVGKSIGIISKADWASQ